MLAAIVLLVAPPVPVVPLPAGVHARSLVVDGRKRTYVLHIPKKLPARAPLVLALHGAVMNGRMMKGFCGMSKKAEAEGFVVAYPDGLGATWNAGRFGGLLGRNRPDDVAFLSRVIDDVAGVARLDESRVYATGMSNGGMMCYRLAAELSGRIAAVAPVAGAMSIDKPKPARPVPLLHIHCKGDLLVPFDRPARAPALKLLPFKPILAGVEEWAKVTGCAAEPKVVDVKPVNGEKVKITRRTWNGGTKGGETVLVSIDGGGHVWPGEPFPFEFVVPSVMCFTANDAIWEFFKKHRLPR